MRHLTPVVWSPSGTHRHWRPTPLRKLGKDEKFLEQVIADCPDLLGLESFRAGFFGPLLSFRRVALESTQGRSIEADIVLLSASGHVVIVEVKLGDNEELRDRQVAAQVIDYATSLTSYSSEDLAELFGGAPGERWGSVVARHFPGSLDPEEIADTVHQRCRDGEVRVVIACDIAPDTASNLVKAMGLQASLGFELKLVEVVPYVSGEGEEILFVPRDSFQTEIVATTRIVVEYKGTDVPQVSVIAPAAESVAELVRQAKSSSRRTWDQASFMDEAKARLASDEYEAVKALFDFTEEKATSMKWGTGSQRGSFNPRFEKVSDRSPYTVFTDGQILFNYGWLDDLEDTKVVRQVLAHRLQDLLGIPPDLKDFPMCPVAKWRPHLGELLSLLGETLVRH